MMNLIFLRKCLRWKGDGIMENSVLEIDVIDYEMDAPAESACVSGCGGGCYDSAAD